MKLNLGCGKNILEGWVNVDARPGPGVDVVLDIDKPNPLDTSRRWQWYDVEEFLLSHALEHCHNPLHVLERAWECARPDALCTVRVPYGASDDADEDPTHVRRYFPGSFGYFGQPNYWRADYGYRGDWRIEKITLKTVHGVKRAEQIMQLRNVVREMVVELRAVKPAREPLQELQRGINIVCEEELIIK